MKRFSEEKPFSVSGIPVALVVLVVAALTLAKFLGVFLHDFPFVPFLVFSLLILVPLSSGFYIIRPNTARVLTLLGRYVGTDVNEGLRWTIPYLVGRQEVSKRLRSFESTKSKVNDAAGNPIEIAGIIVWRILEPANSVFGVEQVSEYIEMQGEAAIRSLANTHPYGPNRQQNEDTLSLQGNPNEVCEILKQDMMIRVQDVGVEIIDARLSHLAYAPEIAAAMLQRQQADALIDAREVIVDGAVGIVGMALGQLDDKNVVTLNDDQKATLVSNLLVVLSGDRTPQPVIQTSAKNT